MDFHSPSRLSNRKALGRREASDDDNDASSDEGLPYLLVGSDKKTRVVEDPPTTTKKLNEEQQQPPVERGVTDVEGFPGEPHDTSVLRDFENYIALRVWNEEMTKFSRPAPEIEGIVASVD
ncbi:hypothetical protein HKD37_13G036294 [Glycine soja]